MNDKDRILTTLVDELASSRLLGRQADGLAGAHGIIADHNGFVRAQFLSDYLVRPKPGDIVRCLTSRDHSWKISRFVEDHGGASGGHYLLREIGSQRLCRIGNESLETLVGVHPHLLYEGHQHRVHRWATVSAFQEKHNPSTNNRYAARPGRCEFLGDVVRVWVRAHIFSDEKVVDGVKLYAQRWHVDVPFTKRTRLRDIVQALTDAGFPREFEYQPEKPAGLTEWRVRAADIVRGYEERKRREGRPW